MTYVPAGRKREDLRRTDLMEGSLKRRKTRSRGKGKGANKIVEYQGTGTQKKKPSWRNAGTKGT